MNKEFVPIEIAQMLKELGFNEPCFAYFDIKYKDFYLSESKNGRILEINNTIKCPLWQQAINFIHSKGIFVVIKPELYVDGINWNWQLLWYLPKDQQTEHKIDEGTGLYGDNGEFPTYELVIEAAVLKAIEILKTK